MLRHRQHAPSLWLPVALALVFGACGDDGAVATLDAVHRYDVIAADGRADTAVAPTDTLGAVDTAAPTDTLGAVDTAVPTDTKLSSDTSSPPDATSPPDTTSPSDTTSPVDTTATTDTAAPTDTAGPVCLTLAPGHARHTVVAYPYGPAGAQTDRFVLYPLLADGSLGAAAADFTLGRANYGVVAFSPDGGLGFAPLDDGRLGVFALAADGALTILDPALDPGVYLSAVVVDGDRLLFVNPNWPASGGGVYAASYDCAGHIGSPALLYPTKNAEGLVLRGTDHIVAARAAGDTTFGHAHLMRPGAAGYTRVGGADLFGHDDAVLSALGMTHDGRFALLGNNSEFADADNAVGVAALTASALTAAPRVTPLLDPVAIVASPHNDAMLVVSGYGNTVRVLGYTPDAATPFTDLGPPAYITTKPQLPGDAVLVGGAFPNDVFVAENLAIRRFRFAGNGVVTDLGRTAEGAGYTSIPGALGVQP